MKDDGLWRKKEEKIREGRSVFIHLGSQDWVNCLVSELLQRVGKKLDELE